MNKSWLAAGTVVVVLSLWMASGLLQSDDLKTAQKINTDPVMTVEVRRVDVEIMDREISLQGQLEPVQHLLLKTETSGKVAKLTVSKGDRVATGATIVQLDQGNRQNLLTEARAPALVSNLRAANSRPQKRCGANGCSQKYRPSKLRRYWSPHWRNCVQSNWTSATPPSRRLSPASSTTCPSIREP